MAIQVPPPLHALQGLDSDLRAALLAQIRDLWTHGSTAIEGNSFSLGETKFVIEEGLAVSGKPLNDHLEVVAHARAIELIYAGLAEPMTIERLFGLHRTVQAQCLDVPIDGWKRETNGTEAVTADGRQTFIEYADPKHVPALMTEWLAELERLAGTPLSETEAIDAYAHLHLGFVHVHPFENGNGRLARLLANIPVLRAGHLPVALDVRDRRRYIEILAEYQQAVGTLTPTTGVWPRSQLETDFRAFCHAAYAATRALAEQARACQERRRIV